MAVEPMCLSRISWNREARPCTVTTMIPISAPYPRPRCRGIPLGDGNFTGCSYGYGDLPPYTGPRDCPQCNGSGFAGTVGTTIPHEWFGDPECCGCLNGVVRGDQADIVCNECAAMVRTVAAAELLRALTEMELTLDVATKSARTAERSICSPASRG